MNNLGGGGDSDFYLGFDPGGAGAFGWCVLSGEDLPLSLYRRGAADHASGAVKAALETIGDGPICGVGIDAPLFWQPGGPARATDRIVDRSIRQHICRKGAPGGTVNAVNSMSGACLIQGIMAAMLLRSAFPQVHITESHPKALLWLIGRANRENRPEHITLTHLNDLVSGDAEGANLHERDAALAAVSSWHMVNESSGWRNLYEEEKSPISPLDPSPSYWLPIS